MGSYDNAKYKFVVVLVDYYSKWNEVAFMSEVTTDRIIQFLESVFAKESLPETLTTDNSTTRFA